MIKRNFTTDPFWTAADIVGRDNANVIEDCVPIAITVLERMREKHPQKKIVQVCGPMTTGGLGDYAKNMAVYRHVRDHVSKLGEYLVFNQDMFTSAFERFDLHTMEVIKRFYDPVLRSGHIHGTFWIRGWESSLGCVGERNISHECFLDVRDCEDHWYPKDLEPALVGK